MLESSKLKEFVEDNFRFDENGRKFVQTGKNTVGKGEKFRYEQFLFFPLFFFLNFCTADTLKLGLVWERV